MPLRSSSNFRVERAAGRDPARARRRGHPELRRPIKSERERELLRLLAAGEREIAAGHGSTLSGCDEGS